MLKILSKHMIISIGLLASTISTSSAAEFDSKNVTIFIVNESTRAIKQMTSFQSLNITADDRDQGFSDLQGSNLIIQANDSYKIQGRITGNTLPASMQVAPGNLTQISSNYSDLYNNGVPSASAEHSILLRFGVDWETETLAENVTLHLKVLSRT